MKRLKQGGFFLIDSTAWKNESGIDTPIETWIRDFFWFLYIDRNYGRVNMESEIWRPRHFPVTYEDTRVHRYRAIGQREHAGGGMVVWRDWERTERARVRRKAGWSEWLKNGWSRFEIKEWMVQIHLILFFWSYDTCIIECNSYVFS